ncbi:TM2 domain-containing protein [Marinobacter sp. DUT-3]|uniref:TM2 domain-containing protein n=1 Tax=unclassified Marinobacter TaxID=83889 RepID=UPI00387B2759
MLRQADVDSEEESLRRAIRELSDEQKSEFYQRARTAIKDPDTYAVLNWFFVVGLHHFYLRRWGRGMINLCSLLIAVGLFMSGWVLIGVCLLSIVYAWELWELFRSQIIVQDWNNRLYRDLLRRY